MDSNILSILAIAISIVTGVIASINHTRIKSMCCGRKLEISLDIEKTTPSPTVDPKPTL